MATTHLLET